MGFTIHDSRFTIALVLFLSLDTARPPHQPLSDSTQALHTCSKMADRKALNHYYPPDFDPSKIPRRKAPKDAQQTVRLMAPFSMRCNTCGEYIYKGRKFNARKELVVGEDYYGIKIFRFYIKCTRCSAEITFKTDPKNTDYAAEHGASRNFVPTNQDELADEEKLLTEEEKLERKLEKMEGDPMKQLEARTIDSRREMEILDALQDIRTRNARLERVDTDAVLAKLHDRPQPAFDAHTANSIREDQQAKAEQEDEALVQKYFGKALDGGRAIAVKRKLDDQDAQAEPDIATLLAMKAAATKTSCSALTASTSVPAPPVKKKKNAPNAFGLVRKKK